MIKEFYKNYFRKDKVKSFKIGGLSWTVLFFGAITLMIRGQYKLSLITLIPFARFITFINANRQRHIALTNKGWKIVK